MNEFMQECGRLQQAHERAMDPTAGPSSDTKAPKCATYLRADPTQAPVAGMTLLALCIAVVMGKISGNSSILELVTVTAGLCLVLVAVQRIWAVRAQQAAAGQWRKCSMALGRLTKAQEKHSKKVAQAIKYIAEVGI